MFDLLRIFVALTGVAAIYDGAERIHPGLPLIWIGAVLIYIAYNATITRTPTKEPQ